MPDAGSPGGFRFLSLTLYVGALLDFGFGVPLLLAPDWMIERADLPTATQLMYPRMNGLFLIVVGLMYVMIAMSPRSFLPFAALAVLGRISGALFYGADVWLFGGAYKLLAFGALNLGLALAHAVGIGKQGWQAVLEWVLSFGRDP